jgi:hypothetical protein
VDVVALVEEPPMHAIHIRDAGFGGYDPFQAAGEFFLFVSDVVHDNLGSISSRPFGGTGAIVPI